jgi:F-type H+-transporting ATPase subunit b
LLVLAALAAGPAVAAEAGHEEKPSLVYWAPESFIWTLLVFLLLLYVLGRFAWKPMLDALRKREETIRGAVEEAKVARAETERVRADFQAQMAKAYEEIPKLMEKARRDAEALAAEMRAKASADIQADRQRLRREVETARDQALVQLRTEAAQLATLISSKVLRRAVSADDHRRFVDEALAEMRQIGEEHQHAASGIAT